MIFASKNIIVIGILLITVIGCGDSNTNPNTDVDRENVTIEYKSIDILAKIDIGIDDFGIGLDDIETFSGEQSLKISNNTTGCITFPIIQNLSVIKNQTYEVSFAVKRTGIIYNCPKIIETFREETITKAGVPIILDHDGLGIEINQLNQTLLETSKANDIADVWKQIIVTFTTDSEDPVSISFEWGYEIFWIDEITITLLNNKN